MATSDTINERPHERHPRMTAPTNGSGGGWIVGNGNADKWRTHDDILGWIWTSDREQAIRYHRREDAEKVHAEDEDAWRVEPYEAAQVGAATDSGEGVALKNALRNWPLQRDDRTRPLLLAAADLRDAEEWNREDAETVIAFLLSRLTSPTMPVADSVEAVARAIDPGLWELFDRPGWFMPDYQPDVDRMEASRARAVRAIKAMPSTDQEGLVEPCADVNHALYSIRHHLAVMWSGDTREGLECALADAKSLVANLEARARQSGAAK